MKEKSAAAVENNIDSQSNGVIFLLCAGALIVLATIALFPAVKDFYFNPPPLSGKSDELGQLGDFVGGLLNPTLSFLTCLILLYSLFLQRKQFQQTLVRLDESNSALANQIKISRNAEARNQLSELVRQWTDSIYDVLNKNFEDQLFCNCKNIQELSLTKNRDFLNTIFIDSMIISAPKIDLEEKYGQTESAIMQFRNLALIAQKKLYEIAGLTKSLVEACDCEQVETHWHNQFTLLSQTYLNAGIISDAEYKKLNEGIRQNV